MADNCYDSKGRVIPCPKGVKAGTIIANSPNDPRLKAYTDSLNLYNLDQKILSAKNLEEIAKYNAFISKRGSIPRNYKSGANWNDAHAIFDNDSLVSVLGQAANKAETNYGNYIRKSDVENEQKTPYTVKGFDLKFTGKPGSDVQPAIIDGVYTGHAKPVQPVVYQKPITQPQEPKLKRIKTEGHIWPNLNQPDSQLDIPNPNFQQANLDLSKPTKFAFTYADYLAGSTPDKQQKTLYFPDLGTLKAFSKQYGKEPSYGADESWGQVLYEGNVKKKKGGFMSRNPYARGGNIVDFLFGDDDDFDEEKYTQQENTAPSEDELPEQLTKTPAANDDFAMELAMQPSQYSRRAKLSSGVNPYVEPANSIDPDSYLTAIFGNEGGKTGVDPANVKGTASGKYAIIKSGRQDLYKMFYSNSMTYENFEKLYNTNPAFEYQVARKLAQVNISKSKSAAEAIGRWYDPQTAQSGNWKTVPRPDFGNRLTMEQYIQRALKNLK